MAVGPRFGVRAGIRDEHALVAALSLGFAVMFGLALWFYLSGKPPADDSPEAGFARDMMVHHAQAVEMSEIVRFKTESENVRVLASDISLTQQAQIGIMQGWLEAWGLPLTGTEPAMAWMGHPTEGRMPGMASPGEIESLENAPPGEADAMFLGLMIDHHEAALPMAEAVLKQTDRPEVERLAQGTVASQRAEIGVMRDMLAGMGEEVPTVEPPHHTDSKPSTEHGRR